MKCKHAHRQLTYGIIMVVAIFSFCNSAIAMSWQYENGVNLDVDVTIGYAAGIRAGDRDEEFLASDVNADDGSQNFDQWDMINNRFSAIADIDLNYKDTYGVFIRPRGFYDFVYTGSNSNASPGTNNNYVGGAIDNPDDFAEETDDAHGRKAEILDAFAYAGFEVGGGDLWIFAPDARSSNGGRACMFKGVLPQPWPTWMSPPPMRQAPK